MKRTFIAIDIPASKEIKECLNILSARLAGEKIKWTAYNNLHLTLKFLGDTENKTISGIESKLSVITKNITAFPITIKNAGVFKNMRDPRIIWFGIEAGQELTELKNLLETEIAPFGFPPEKRNFSPHLTVGRVRFLGNRNILNQIIDDYYGQILQQFNVPEIVFYESILKKEGPEYIPLGRYKLQIP
jgi:2'-5' RNA ligase